ncbi:MAG TPA: hypothetical protein VGC95_08850 [Chitinophagaceae bacterium]|jgi:hypothetical protein
MKNDNNTQREKDKQQKNRKNNLSTDNPMTPGADDTSMSSGNLVNNPRGRERTSDLHTKNSITGTDNDGQVD